MPKKYFSEFPKIQYPYEGKIVTPQGNSQFVSRIECADLMVRYKFIDKILNNPTAYYDYSWREFDRPDSIADMYYGNSDFAWVVMLSGEIFHWIYDLPLSNSTFNRYLQKKYETSDVASLLEITDHYEDGEGFIIDEDSYNEIVDPNKKEVSVFEHENNLNERKRIVKLISKEFVSQIDREFSEKLKKIMRQRAESTHEFIL